MENQNYYRKKGFQVSNLTQGPLDYEHPYAQGKEEKTVWEICEANFHSKFPLSCSRTKEAAFGIGVQNDSISRHSWD